MFDFLLSSVLDMPKTIYSALWLFVLFGVLEKLMPCNRNQPLVGRGLLVDTGYLLVVPIFGRIVQNFYLVLGAALIFHGKSDDEIKNYVMNGYGPLGQLPLWLKAAIVFMLSDVMLYWTHRWFHSQKMWKFHAIHHSSTEVEWHSNYRFHPVNIWLSFTLVDMLMIFMGLSLHSIILFGTFNMLYSAMVHANLNWTFGPFKYIFSSPVFHRWHHTSQEEGMNKNFAPTFPLLDIIFGTFYMPEGRLPEHYGVTGSDIPESFLGQMVWPFKAR